MFKLNGVTKIYSNNVIALKSVSIDFPNKGFVTLLGKSGCGKSTMLNILSGMDNYTSGELLYDGKLIAPKDKISTVNSEFAFIHQDYKLIENISVAGNIAISKELNGGIAVNQEILDVLQSVELSADVAEQKVKFLSGGQKQRVAIARAIFKQSKVIFADEPTGNLDSENSSKIFETLKRLSRYKLVILVTHDKESAEQYSDIIFKLVDGKVVNTTILHECNNVVDDKSLAKISPPQIQKKRGHLSFKQTCSLGCWSLAHKPIRLIVSTVLAILISIFCCFSFSLLFMTKSQVFANDFPKGDNRYILLQDENSAKFIDKIAVAIGKDVAKAYRNSSTLQGAFFNESWSKEARSVYYDNIITHTIVADDLNIIGSKLVAGRMPEKAYEVLLPKTFADSLIVKKLYGSINNYGKQPRIELNSYEDIFKEQLYKSAFDYSEFSGEKVVGIFDDRNEIDHKFKQLVTGGMQYENKNTIAQYEKQNDNFLLNAEVRPISYFAAMQEMTFAKGGNSTVSFGGNPQLTLSKGEMHRPSNIVTDSVVVAEFFDQNHRLVPQGQIALNKKNINGLSIAVGDIVELKLEVYQQLLIVNTVTMQLQVSEILDDYVGDHIISQQDYSTFMSVSDDYCPLFLFNSQGLDIKNVANQIEETIFSIDKNHGEFIVYNAQGTTNAMNWYDFEFGIVNDYVAIPLVVVTVLMLIIFMYMVISVNIEIKSKDWMVLRAEGAKYKDILGAVAFQHVWLVLAQLIAGVLLTMALCPLLNSTLMLSIVGGGRFFLLNYSEIFLVISTILVSATTILLLCTMKLFRKKVAFAINKNK